MNTKKNKDYLTLANERAKRQQREQAIKNKILKDKLDYQKEKDKKTRLSTIILTAPLYILIVSFVII